MLSELNENKSKLEYDIFEEIGLDNSTVSVISFDPIALSNWTTVTFGIWPYPSNSTISPTGLSILRSSLVSLVIQQSTLHLTPSLFGSSSSFEILRFPGGITIIPPQNAFVPQKPDALFNFSLNFPIDIVQDRVSELKAQMKSGLFLNIREILYVTLSNLDGSTVAPPTVVQTSVLLAFGADNKPPSLQRLKQLAQTLRNSSSGNLGLNHTVFGRVKQISLSSYLQHSLNNAGSAHSPSPAPQPNQPHSTHQNNNHDRHHHHHHHHSHHHHHHHHDLSHQGSQHLTPAPAPMRSTPNFVSCDSSCARKKVHSNAKRHSAPRMDPPLRPIAPVPNSYKASGPYVDPPSFHPRFPSLPAVVFHAMPPGDSVETSKPPNKFSSISPAPSTYQQHCLSQSNTYALTLKATHPDVVAREHRLRPSNLASVSPLSAPHFSPPLSLSPSTCHPLPPCLPPTFPVDLLRGGEWGCETSGGWEDTAAGRQRRWRRGDDEGDRRWRQKGISVVAWLISARQRRNTPGGLVRRSENLISPAGSCISLQPIIPLVRRCITSIPDHATIVEIECFLPGW